MNWDRIEGNWKQWTGKAKSQWGKLTDDALTQAGGRRDQLVGKIQEAYGISKDEAERQVNDWSSSLDRDQSGREQTGYGAQGYYPRESMPQDWERTGREISSQMERTHGSRGGRSSGPLGRSGTPRGRAQQRCFGDTHSGAAVRVDRTRGGDRLYPGSAGLARLSVELKPSTRRAVCRSGSSPTYV